MDKNLRPKISIVIPFHWMKNWQGFMNQCLASIEKQTFTDYEIILTKSGLMAENTNKAIKCAKGELIKILYLDDQLAHDHALNDIVEAMEGKQWLITGCDTNEYPFYTDDIHTGNNKLGSPSCLTIRNDNPQLFDENLSWLLDCCYYKRMYDLYGEPKILDGVHVVMGVGDHQVTNLLPEEVKESEYIYMNKKYG